MHFHKRYWVIKRFQCSIFAKWKSCSKQTYIYPWFVPSFTLLPNSELNSCYGAGLFRISTDILYDYETKTEKNETNVNYSLTLNIALNWAQAFSRKLYLICDGDICRLSWYDMNIRLYDIAVTWYSITLKVVSYRSMAFVIHLRNNTLQTRNIPIAVGGLVVNVTSVCACVQKTVPIRHMNRQRQTHSNNGPNHRRYKLYQFLFSHRFNGVAGCLESIGNSHFERNPPNISPGELLFSTAFRDWLMEIVLLVDGDRVLTDTYLRVSATSVRFIASIIPCVFLIVHNKPYRQSHRITFLSTSAYVEPIVASVAYHSYI